jgi:hypothetical protein
MPSNTPFHCYIYAPNTPYGCPPIAPQHFP